jgi:hypothetical protein
MCFLFHITLFFKRIIMKHTITLLLFNFLLSSTGQAEIIVIGHKGLPKMDKETIQKIYTGKIITLAGTPVTPLNLLPEAPERQQFLAKFLHQDEEKYTGYWIVRRAIGKGTPPKEVSKIEELIRFINETPGALGYIDNTNINNKLSILAK